MPSIWIVIPVWVRTVDSICGFNRFMFMSGGMAIIATAVDSSTAMKDQKNMRRFFAFTLYFLSLIIDYIALYCVGKEKS